LFAHRDFPGARFGHRFSGYEPALERIELKEEIETGALHRLMQSHPAPDGAGVIWTAWEDPDQRVNLGLSSGISPASPFELKSASYLEE
jgi:hypothetical protein